MDEASINFLQKDLTDEFYSLTQDHCKEIKNLVEEFEDERMQLAINLEKYEKERIQSTKEFDEPDTEERAETKGTEPFKEGEPIEQIEQVKNQQTNQEGAELEQVGQTKRGETELEQSIRVNKVEEQQELQE